MEEPLLWRKKNQAVTRKGVLKELTTWLGRWCPISPVYINMCGVCDYGLNMHIYI